MGAPAQVNVGWRDQRCAAVQAVQVQEAAVPLRSPRQEPVLPVVRQRHLRAQPASLIVLAVDEGLDISGKQETPCSGGALLPP